MPIFIKNGTEILKEFDYAKIESDQILKVFKF